MANAEFLKRLSKIVTPSYIKVSELTVDTKYIITNAIHKDTKFGRSVAVTLDNDGELCKLYLPKRYSIIKKRDLGKLINNFVIYKGRVNNTDIIEFEENTTNTYESDDDE